MQNDRDIYKLSEVDVSQRDPQWEDQFLKGLPSAQFKLLNDTPQTGPDGWPYLLVELDSGGDAKASDVLGWLVQKGVGLAINPQKSAPDYILSFGMIWNYINKNEFISNRTATHEKSLKLEAGEKIHAGEPSDDYLPPSLKNILRAFFKNNEIEN